MTLINSPGHAHDRPDAARTASCACGSFGLAVTGEPGHVYTCHCLDCQRATGSAFACRAWFKTEAVTRIDGEHRTWRRLGTGGRWVEHVFCPTCGSIVYVRGEVLPDTIFISVGCFADPSFATPTAAYWTSRQHPWFALPETTRSVDAQ
ncbi:GFA family protein [Phreatobacter stygius]|uniref:GFA family protein n=1 Tax=Phreatobacter stygius TaxID=1940610 RepID=A0A4D7BDG5_9HYPH|nr:GFA family protein [Phreatobacter stygius]QCI68028.1 GFA family protein [Phreatobacter stygius]